jgi:hypothetical protein
MLHFRPQADAVLLWVFDCVVERGEGDGEGLPLLHLLDFGFEFGEVEGESGAAVFESFGGEVLSVEVVAIHRHDNGVGQTLV